MTTQQIFAATAIASAAGLAAYALLRTSTPSGQCPIPESLRHAFANPHHPAPTTMSEEKKSVASTTPTVVVITGAAGQIAYSLIFGVASGRLLGDKQTVELRLLDIPPALKILEGVAMELDDCAYPLVTKSVITTDYEEAFKGADIALLVGARPRGPGMDRKDLLTANASIFKGQGASLNAHASKNVKILVVGNPANTNALITKSEAPTLEQANFTAMTRLDQNRAKSQLAKRLSVSTNQIKNVIIWGNHSNTQYPDVNHAYVQDYPNKGDKTPIRAAIKDDQWLNGEFIKTVQLRGGAIIEKLGKSSAASAANAAIDHVRDWISGSDEYVSMAVPSTGVYGIPAGVIFSFPCTVTNGHYKIVEGLTIDDFSRGKIQASYEELLQEKKDAGVQ